MLTSLINTSALPILLLSLAMSACAPKDGGQVGEENIVCQAVLTQEIERGDLSPLGFSVDDLLVVAEGSHQSPLTWADGTTTVLHLTLSFDNSATYQDREWINEPTDGAPEPAPLDNIDCPDILSLEMSVSISTEDGALDESWSVALQAAVVSEAAFTQQLEALMGTLAIEDFAPSNTFDAYSAYLDLVIDQDGVHGTISGQAESGGSGGTPDGTVSATSYPIASFGPN